MNKLVHKDGNNKMQVRKVERRGTKTFKALRNMQYKRLHWKKLRKKRTSAKGVKKIRRKSYCMYLHLISILKDFKLLQVFLELKWCRWKVWIYSEELCIIALAQCK